MQLSQKSLNTSVAPFELINQIKNCSQKTWKDGSKFQTLSWSKNFFQRTVQNGEWGEKLHNNTNRSSGYYRCKQLKQPPPLSLRINVYQPLSHADGCYSCHTDLCRCQYSCQVFWTGIEGELTNKSNFMRKEPLCDTEELQDQVLQPFTRTASIQHISFDSNIFFFNSRQLHVFAFISSTMFTTPIRMFCNLI